MFVPPLSSQFVKFLCILQIFRLLRHLPLVQGETGEGVHYNLIFMQYFRIKAFARHLRNNPTPSEKTAWFILRKKQIRGYKFLRQYIIIYDRQGPEYYCYVADFYCAKLKAIIEIDGKIHEYQKKHDKHRDKMLEIMKIKILRIKNTELENINEVKLKINFFISEIESGNKQKHGK